MKTEPRYSLSQIRAMLHRMAAQEFDSVARYGTAQGAEYAGSALKYYAESAALETYLVDPLPAAPPAPAISHN